MTQEKYIKNGIVCSFATSDGKGVLGFCDSDKPRPKSLLKETISGDKVKRIDLLMRKQTGEETFTEIIIGNNQAINKYYESIKQHISYTKEEVAATNEEVQAAEIKPTNLFE